MILTALQLAISHPRSPRFPLDDAGVVFYSIVEDTIDETIQG